VNTLVVSDPSAATLVSPIETVEMGTPQTIVAVEPARANATKVVPQTLASADLATAPEAMGTPRTVVVPPEAMGGPATIPLTVPGRSPTAGEIRPAVTSAPTESASSKTPMILLGAVAVVGIGVYLGVLHARKATLAPEGSSASPTLAPEPVSVEGVPTTAVAVSTTAPPPNIAPSSQIQPIVDAPKEVTLHIVTEPPGAVLLKAGFQVCDTTPCDVVVSRNDPIELEARKGNLKGAARILAQHAQTVTINLAGAAAKPKAPAGPRMCEVEVEGLKILRPCPQ
jgi:hypothetical protein